MGRRLSFLILFSALAAIPPEVRAAPERTVKARILEIDGRHDRVRAEVGGRPTVFRAAGAGVLRGFRKGDLVFLRVRGGVVFDARLAAVTAEVLGADERSAVLRIGERERRYALARPDLRRRLKKGDFVRVEVEERRDGTRVVTRVY